MPCFSYIFLNHNLYIYLNLYHLPQPIVEIDLASFLKFTTILRTFILTVMVLEMECSKRYTLRFMGVRKQVSIWSLRFLYEDIVE